MNIFKSMYHILSGKTDEELALENINEHLNEIETVCRKHPNALVQSNVFARLKQLAGDREAELKASSPGEPAPVRGAAYKKPLSFGVTVNGIFPNMGIDADTENDIRDRLLEILPRLFEIYSEKEVKKYATTDSEKFWSDCVSSRFDFKILLCPTAMRESGISTQLTQHTAKHPYGGTEVFLVTEVDLVSIDFVVKSVVHPDILDALDDPAPVVKKKVASNGDDDWQEIEEEEELESKLAKGDFALNVIKNRYNISKTSHKYWVPSHYIDPNMSYLDLEANFPLPKDYNI